MHLPGFAGDLYDQTLDVAFLERLRTMDVFDSLEALVAQMEADTARSVEIFENFSPRDHQLLG